MENREKIERLCHAAACAGLSGLELIDGLGFETIARQYNGIGPESFKPELRGKLTRILALFEPAALIHDLRNYLSDGRRETFHFANLEFLANCRTCAKARYPWWSLKRYRAYSVAGLMFKFVDGAPGWRAWMDCYERNKEEERKAPGIWPGSQENKKGKTMNRLTMMALAACAAAMAGCRSIEIENRGEGKGWSVDVFSHWMNSEADSLNASIAPDGTVSFEMNGMRSTPSEEFNKMMGTTMQSFTAMARLAASMYSPAAASIPLTPEAADAAATAKLVDAQGAAKAAEIKAKSDRETARIKAKSDAAIAEKQAGAACTDGSCTAK